MSLYKMFSAAMETVTGVIRRSSSWDRAKKVASGSIMNSDSQNSLRRRDSTEGNKYTAYAVQKLDKDRPHSAGPLYGRNSTEQMLRIRKICRDFTARRLDPTICNSVKAGKSASILYRVGNWLENSDIQHPETRIKKSPGKPVIVKIPLTEYGSRDQRRLNGSPVFREIKRQKRLSWYQRVSLTDDCSNHPRFHKLQKHKQRPDDICAEQLTRKIQINQMFARSVEKKIQSYQARIQTQSPRIALQHPKSTYKKDLQKTLQEGIIRHQQKLKSQIGIKHNMPIMVKKPPQRIMFLNRSEEKQLEQTQHLFRPTTAPLILPIPMTHKERLEDILKKYKHVIQNFDLPKHSEVTASLYAPQNKIDETFTNTNAFLRQLKKKRQVLILKKHPDLITVINFQKQETTRPIITVPVTVVSLPSTKDDDRKKDHRGRKPEPEGKKK